MIHKVIPPFLLQFIKNVFFYNYGWKGNYKDWETAKKMSLGYDANTVLQEIDSTMKKVVRNPELLERDGVIIEKLHYNWDVITSILYAFNFYSNKVTIVDFGGSLGSSYFQISKYVHGIPKQFDWAVIEQPNFVEKGRNEFQKKNLFFYDSLHDCLQHHNNDILLLSSVLQYLPNPYEMLEEFLTLQFKFIIIDLTAITLNDSSTQITVQKVPSIIYNASYPCYILDYTKIDAIFKKHNYKLIKNYNPMENFHMMNGFTKLGKYFSEIRILADD